MMTLSSADREKTSYQLPVTMNANNDVRMYDSYYWRDHWLLWDCAGATSNI